MKYRKKPVVVDAMQLPADGADASDELLTFLHEMGENWSSERDGSVVLRDRYEGVMVADPGDWIIRGVKGEYYPCKPDIFEKSYDMAWEATMTHERWTEVEKNQELKLTAQEIADGWHFCPEWDGLLVNSNDEEGEGAACICS